MRLEQKKNSTAKGTFYIYTDGCIGTANWTDVSLAKDVKMLIQGINLNHTANGSKSLRESMNKEGWNLVSDTQVCNHGGIGYDYKTDTIKVIISKTDLHGLRDAALKEGCVDKEGAPVFIALDAGGSFAYVHDGNIVYKSDGRFMRNIVYW